MSTANKLTYLNTTKTKIREGLNSLGADLDTEDTFRSYADAIEGIYEDYPKITGEGESLSLDNTKQASMKIDYKGNTSQETTTGINILAPTTATNPQSSNGITRTTNPDGSVTLTGTATANSYLRISNDLTLESNTNYTTYNANGALPSGVTLYYNNNENIGQVYTGTNITPGNTLKSYTTGTVTGTVNIAVLIQSGTTINATIYPMLVKGTYTVQTKPNYETFTGGTPSPNPSYPQPVNVVSGDNEILITGKNKIINIDIFDGYPTGSVGGTIGFNSSANSKTYKKCAYVVANKPYTLSWNPNTPKATGTRDIKIVDDNNIILEYFSYFNTNNNRQRTFTPTKSGWIYATLDTNATEVQIEDGIAPTDYEIGQGYSYPIYLGVEELFDKDNANILNAYFEASTPNLSSNDNARTLYIECLPNTTYTITKLRSQQFNVGCINTEPIIGTTVQKIENGPTGVYDGSTKSSYTYTTNSTAKYLLVRYAYATQVDLSLMLSSIKIQKGNKINHASTTPIELCKIGDYQDYIYKENKKWYLHKEIGKVVLNGSNDEIWSRSGATTETSFVGALNLQITGIITKFNTGDYWLCDKFTYGSLGVDYKFRLYNGDASSGYVFLGLTIPTTLASDINAFRTWLGNNNVTLYYVLKEPIATEITDTTLINQLEESKLSYISQTNISQENNDLPFILDVKALRGE